MDFIVTSTATISSYRYENIRDAAFFAGSIMSNTCDRPGTVIEIRSIVRGEVVTNMVGRWVNCDGGWIAQH